jgi:uncharacterized protein YecT (DUF1311 family)
VAVSVFFHCFVDDQLALRSEWTDSFVLRQGVRLLEFEIEAVLGQGGFGITYRAIDTLLQEQVAIKEYFPSDLAVRVSGGSVRAKSGAEIATFETGLRSFLEEARMMARFRHPRLVHVRRFFELRGTGYIVQDYERGQTFASRMSERPLSDSEHVQKLKAYVGTCTVCAFRDSARTELDSLEKRGLAQPLLVPRINQQPSFHCATAKEPIEFLICADAELAMWDGRMGQAHRHQLTLLAGNRPRSFRQQQRNWLVRQDTKCNVPLYGGWSLSELAPKTPCLLEIIKQRVTELMSD